MKIVKAYQVRELITESGSSPFREWLNRLDVVTRARVQARITRAEQGNLGEYKILDQGVHEFKMDFGPGYRVYFGIKDKEIILLLTGGDKKTQKRDIKKAQALWASFLGGI